jgi:ankyrin repeat protein
MADWIDPRTDPSPPYRGLERPLAADGSALAGLIAACKEGRLYDIERWIADGRPIQAEPAWTRQNRRRETPLSAAMAQGSFDLVRLLLCNGYRTKNLSGNGMMR